MNDEVAKSSPWDVFIHLLAVIALYVSVYAAITLLLEFVELGLPDSLDQGADPRDYVRYCVALLVIFFPTYCWAWRSIERDLATNPGKRRLWTRTYPLYLTLFLAGLLALGDFVCLLYFYMSGDLTSRFVLKVLSVLVVAAGVFFFYRDTLRREPGPLPRATRIFAYAAEVFAVVLTVGGLIAAGSPNGARLAGQDLRRLRDLESIQKSVVDYWKDKGELPDSLDQLKDDIAGYSPERDPDSFESYGYRKTATTSFELCSNFALKDSDAMKRLDPWRQDSTTSTAWNHDAGHYCFARTIDPARYPAKKSRSPCN